MSESEQPLRRQKNCGDLLKRYVLANDGQFPAIQTLPCGLDDYFGETRHASCTGEIGQLPLCQSSLPAALSPCPDSHPRVQDKKLVAKVTDDLAPRFATRPGGYTRVVKAGFRSHDKAPLAYIEYLDNKLPPLTLTKDEFGTSLDGACLSSSL